MTDEEKVRILQEALEDAYDHLQDCDFGTPSEREKAKSIRLPEKILYALEAAKYR